MAIKISFSYYFLSRLVDSISNVFDGRLSSVIMPNDESQNILLIKYIRCRNVKLKHSYSF